MPEADLTATPNDGYIFGKWTNDKNSDTSKDGAFDLGVQKTGQTITVTANFIKITYVVEDTSGNSITPKTEVTDPKEGALIEDANGNKWIVRKITDPDEDGVAKVIVEAYNNGTIYNFILGFAIQFLPSFQVFPIEKRFPILRT